MESDWSARYHALRTAYQSAFHELAAEAGVLRELASRGLDNTEKLETARRRVETATLAYRNRRDSLTDFLLKRCR